MDFHILFRRIREVVTMSEQRFTYDNPIGFGKGEIVDNVTGETFEATISVMLGLLNEQQATINSLNIDISRKDEVIKILQQKIKELEK